MGKSVSNQELGPGRMLSGNARDLGNEEIESLWEICCEINGKWRLFCDEDQAPSEHALYKMRSSWLEFIRLRANPQHLHQGPSYIGEYENAIKVIAQLKDNCPENVFEILFSVNADAVANPTADGKPPAIDQLGHAKKFVIDEFMTVMIVSGGFKNFGGKNYNGYMAGSRFNRTVEIAAPFTFPKRDG